MKFPGYGGVCDSPMEYGFNGKVVAVALSCKRGSCPPPAVTVIGMEATAAVVLPLVPAGIDMVTVAVPV